MSTTAVTLENMPLDELRRLTIEAEQGVTVADPAHVVTDPPKVDPPVTADSAPVVDDKPKRFRRDIDLKDGSGIQRFEGATMDELLDNLVKAQENATRKI